MTPITTNRRPWGGKDCIVFEMEVFPLTPEISLHATMPCKLRLRQCGYDSKRYPTLHFSIGSGNGGMAYPEVLRGYAKLFTHAADLMEGKEPIDFQI
ncbi:MAG: hypothetical protein JWR19_2190 [Pedosphaera sp.]|nr:hypothetical protein [Pedosphaera sp.]